MGDLVSGGILHQEAVPGHRGDLHHAVEQRRHGEKPEALAGSPDQAGNAPGQEIKKGGGKYAPVAVDDGAGEKGEDRLREHVDGRDQSHLHVAHPEGQHEDRGIGQAQVHGQAPHRLRVDAGAGIAAQFGQGAHQRVLEQESVKGITLFSGIFKA